MEAKTTIRKMLAGNTIYVPNYQRAYSWDVTRKEDSKNQVKVFYADLQDHLKSGSTTPYYFGHFLYEVNLQRKDYYGIIDGQQRLTTITIFLSALFAELKKRQNGSLSEEEQILYEDLIKRGSTIYRFTTVEYDKQLFRDYVVNGEKKDHNGLDTTSAKRIVDAYDYFSKVLTDCSLEQLQQLLHLVTNSFCSTYQVENPAEAVQMFIFQNNRGKRPSLLEIIKAQFMYCIHIYGGEETNSILDEVINRFEKIYKAISYIENFVDEDDVLRNTLKVYFNNLDISNASEKIDECLNMDNNIRFIVDFSRALDNSFTSLVQLNKDRLEDVSIESALVGTRYDIVLPFLIKAYVKGISKEQISLLAKALGDLALRDAFIRTRADLAARLNGKFKEMEDSAHDVIVHINWMKTVSSEFWWWAYWNNESLLSVLNSQLGSGYHWAAKILLWRYENYLIKEGKGGYAPIRFADIKNPQLEHISPQTENNEHIESGYDTYDEDFRTNYLYSIGNFLLLSGTHNESIGNRPFEQKRATYTQLRQQQEVCAMTETDHKWTRDKIAQRKAHILQFVNEEL